MFGRMMVSALALTGVAYAQETPPAPQGEAAATPTESSADRTVYDAAFFAQYNPQTANDMVQQVPGFTLSNGDGRRGFSGAVGNLLIDGVRPTSKSQGVGGILSRIPANQVVRIEVLRGAAVAGDASGQSTLLNIVRTANAGSGTWSTGIEYTSREVAAPRADVSYSGRNGQLEWGVGGSIFSQYRDLPGWRRLYNEPSDTLYATVDTPSPRDYREASLNGNVAFPLFGGRLSATSQIDWFRFHADSDYIFSDPGGAFVSSLDSSFTERQRQPSYEVGVNYDRDFGPWSMALVGLINRGFYGSDEHDIDTETAPPGATTIVQTLDRKTGETILRGSLARQITDQHRIEFGAEGAYNSLDQRLDLTFDNGGGPVTAFIPNSNVLVEENRAEFFAVDTWRPNDRWSVESRLAWETSTLTFSGDTNQEVPLDYWKPSIQISRNIGENNQVRLRLYRDVGQLNFDDFVSAAAIADALIAGGNPDLAPQTEWRAELGLDWHFGEAALTATLTQHWISDVNDVVQIVAPNPDEDPLNPNDDFIRFDAPGNIGDGQATSLDVNYSTPLNWFLPGARVNVIGYLWQTSVTDPVTGLSRIISGRPETQLEVDFRQDIRDWKVAWGINFFKQGEQQAYRFNEIDSSEEGPWVDFFVETTALPHNMKLRLWALNFMNGEVHRDRRFFNAPDRSGPNTSRDLRQRIFDEAPWVMVELSGTF